MASIKPEPPTASAAPAPPNTPGNPNLDMLQGMLNMVVCAPQHAALTTVCTR
jgi:hypothetical protein